MLSTVQTTIKMNPHVANNLPSAKQLKWLEVAIKEYGITLDLRTIESIAKASEHITRIQNAINSGKLKSVVKMCNSVILHTWYVVIELDELVSIKTFTGSKIEASAKARAKYGQCVKFASTELEESKAKAIELRNIRTQSEVACGESTATEAEVTMDMLNAMSVEELRELASAMNVELGRSKKKETIMARILA